MGRIVGTVAGIIIFGLVGLVPAFRFGSYLALFILQKATGRPVEATLWPRLFIISTTLILIFVGSAVFAWVGALIGGVLPF